MVIDGALGSVIGWIVIVMVAFYAGYTQGQARGRKNNKARFRLLMNIDCTQKITITLEGKDSEGNIVEIPAEDVKFSYENVVGNFANGDVVAGDNPGEYVFDPGDAGATGTLKCDVAINGEDFFDSVDLTLEPGALASVKMNLKPKV